jgi:hypothetical protein
MRTRSSYEPEIDNKDSPEYWHENLLLAKLRNSTSIENSLLPDSSINVCTRCPAALWSASKHPHPNEDFDLNCVCSDNQKKKWWLNCGTGVFECSKRLGKIEEALARMSEKNERVKSA